MGRTIRYILRLLIVSLLVSAGGIAASQTLSRYISYDDLASQVPLKASHTDQLEAGHSIADQHQLAAIRQVTSPLTCQACRQRSSIGPVHQHARYPAVRISFIQLYPQSLPPPPRPASFFL